MFSLHPSLYFFLKSFFHLFLMSTLVPDENSMKDPLCNSSFGSMVSLDYVTPDTGVIPEACNILERIARQDDPTAVVWKGSDILTQEQRLKILGTPFGHPDFVERHLEHVARKQQVLLDRIPLVSDVQSGCCCCIARLPGPISS